MGVPSGRLRARESIVSLMVSFTSVPLIGRRTPGKLGLSGLTRGLANWRTPLASKGGDGWRPRGRRRRTRACAAGPPVALKAASTPVDFRKVRLVNIWASRAHNHGKKIEAQNLLGKRLR